MILTCILLLISLEIYDTKQTVISVCIQNEYISKKYT